jgi:hypothetical protein
MMRSHRKAMGTLALLVGALILGLWWAGVRKEPAPAAAALQQDDKEEYARKALETLRAAGFTDP